MDLTFAASAGALRGTGAGFPPVVHGVSPASGSQASSIFSNQACATAACAAVAAAGLAATTKKRRSAARGAYQTMDEDVNAGPQGFAKSLPAHMQPVNTCMPGRLLKREPFWDISGSNVTPVPGSEKMLQTMVGADVEVGDGKPWDPFGLAKLYDRNFDFNYAMTYPHVQFLREAEIKHGRVAMLAYVGILAKSVVTIPGYPDIMEWDKAYDVIMSGGGRTAAEIGIAQIWLFCMVLEGKFFPADAWVGQMEREPGDLGFDPLGFTKSPNFDMKAMQLKELKNGRLAMLAVAAIASALKVPGAVPGLAALPSVQTSKAATASALCGASKIAALASANVGASKTAARYTTQIILPSLTWVKTGLSAKDFAPTQLKAVTLAGNDVLIGKTEAGKLFCVGNLCPHIGTPMSEGADVIGDVIVCPLHGSSFKTTTGELIDWCVSPPIIGPLTGLVVEKKNLLIFDCRESGFLGGGEIEVLVDTNAKKAYEADYWKGILDAQGKDDGSYY
eukprot:TRINITY_DN2356_c0_g1_i5.p1 TRINITY_DN2356_c0_g1~~TRINITY_DN2356_c0_g1_i5.p1  ORF type:complete len:505 (+),score=100.12 TRINITY_DN2356_c0_g1_i5:47-1561(+)